MILTSFVSRVQEDVEAEMRRLREELKQTIDMYSTACKEALSAKQKVLLYISMVLVLLLI